MTTTRFAPSPTGLLHLGHAYSAKVAFDLAREHNGTFLLRHEDIDSSRVRDEFYQSIEEDLRWLGLNWDGEILTQLPRQAVYESVLNQLKKTGIVYPCFCTRRDIQAEIARSASAPHIKSHLYPGTCRELPTHISADKIANGASHAWRLDAKGAQEIHGPLTFVDSRFGNLTVNPELNGDAVIARKDIGIAYHLAVVVDDEFQNITHVTRGDDLLDSTHIHRQLQAILSYREPTYLHHPSVCDSNGKRLAKRDNAMSIQQLRSEGISPEEIFVTAQNRLNQ
ncbi:MAG: tRNA glutamyl-Q(34) synthetase GluQRS [Akkermansiaceae bacterium]